MEHMERVFTALQKAGLKIKHQNVNSSRATYAT